ncbi:MAG: hypothetical protein QOJ98_2985 [Acidobacteriota bacterium]|nr:hypothetical protein [Acidobacteriota bacterium]
MGVPPWTIAEATSLSLQREPEGLDQRFDAAYFPFNIPKIPRTIDCVTVRVA